MNIKRITWEQTIPIRHKVLWPDKAPSFCKVENDENAIHYGVEIDTRIVSVASIYVTAKEARLRKFATLAEYQNRGIGSQLIKRMLADAIAAQMTCVWFDARETAIEFYKRFGFEVSGARFYKNDVTYFKMSKQLPYS